MLTKEHLSFRVRNGRAVPLFVDVSDARSRAAAVDLLSVFEEAEGARLGDLEAEAEAVAEGDLGAALSKLLLDACETEDDDGQVEDARWRTLLSSEAMRREKTWPALADFQQELLKTTATSSEGLYADLPACRRVRSYKVMDAEALLHRYNVAQVQGLLLRARRVVVRLWSADLSQRREIFRQLRFHRLIGEVRPLEATRKKPAGFEVELTGPLSIFDQATTYGLRLANFFPRVLLLSDWEIEAEVHVKNRELSLKLDAGAQLKSHYKEKRPYIPEELTALIEAFNERMAPQWKLEPGSDFVHLGKESYCFPDLTMTGEKGSKIHVELFHRWHAQAFLGRLQALNCHPHSDLYLGVSKSLLKDAELKANLEGAQAFAKNGFYFSDFPTPKALVELLNRRSSAGPRTGAAESMVKHGKVK